MRLPSRRAFTLVELLVVIAIIGVLVALLLPAVQAARESARRMQCSNHLKQIALAAHNHHDTHGYFPSGGWGWLWTGIPERGFGERQPGGWAYSLLPYMEQGNLHGAALGKTGTDRQTAMKSMMSTPLSAFYCPSRRAPQPSKDGYTYYDLAGQIAPGISARSDYAANCGDQERVEITGGPDTIGKGDGTESGWTWTSTSIETGISFQRSEVTMGDITDGTSNTMWVGEKYLCPDNYKTGSDGGDNENLYVGYDNDLYRSTFPGDTRFPPLSDRLGYCGQYRFGAAHGQGFQIALCDGSVRMISYTVDKDNLRRLGHRSDGQVLETSKL